jgi:hypothetical protein
MSDETRQKEAERNWQVAELCELADRLEGVARELEALRDELAEFLQAEDRHRLN